MTSALWHSGVEVPGAVSMLCAPLEIHTSVCLSFQCKPERVHLGRVKTLSVHRPTVLPAPVCTPTASLSQGIDASLSFTSIQYCSAESRTGQAETTRGPNQGLMPPPEVPAPVPMASVLSWARFVGHMGGAEDTIRAF